MWRHPFSPARALQLVPSCLLLLGCPGCGLLFVPTIETFPDPVRRVSVCDATTGAALPSVSVDVHVVYVSTKAYLFDTAGTYPSSVDGDPVRLAVRPKGRGSFIPRATWRIALWQCLFPLFSWDTAGDWWYYGHSNEIIVRAPGYETVAVDYPAWTSRRHFSKDACSLRTGTLTVPLTPSPAPP